MTLANSKVELTELLFRQAETLFGRKRAETLRPALDERARHIFLVSALPLDEEEPAFVFLPEEVKEVL
jgi:hypothetical protein